MQLPFTKKLPLSQSVQVDKSEQIWQKDKEVLQREQPVLLANM